MVGCTPSLTRTGPEMITYTDESGSLRYSSGVKIVSYHQDGIFKHWRAGYVSRRPDAKAIIRIEDGMGGHNDVNTNIHKNTIRDVGDLLVADAAGFNAHEPAIPQHRRGRLCDV